MFPCHVFGYATGVYNVVDLQSQLLTAPYVTPSHVRISEQLKYTGPLDQPRNCVQSNDYEGAERERERERESMQTDGGPPTLRPTPL